MSNTTTAYTHPILNHDSSSFDKNTPFAATLIKRTPLTTQDANKLTIHIELDLQGSNFNYKCGDSVGIYPTNHPDEVSAIINALNTSADTPVTLPKQDTQVALSQALSFHLSLANPTKTFLKTIASLSQDPHEQETIASLIQNPEACQEYLANRQFIDLLEDFPNADISPQTLVSSLKRLVPRLYSIASSPKVHPNHVHLTLAVLNYTTNDHPRIGVATTFLDNRAPLNSPTIPTFLAPSKHFELPSTLDKPIIMIGPGTGIAPFRAFLQEIQASSHNPKTWLFFGEQNESSTFLYQSDLQAFLDDQTLTTLTTAFSRDQEQKIYVQHRLQEHASTLWQWIQEGAYIYVCGDAKHMAKDVQQTLLNIFETHGNLDPAQAKDFLKSLKSDNRYQRDVY